MTQAAQNPFALVNIAMTQGEQQHRQLLQNLERNFAERRFGYEKLQNDRARNDMFYMNTQGRMDAAFWDNFSKSMGEMTFGAMMADVRAQRAANTPPLFLFDDKEIMPNPNANQILAGAGPGAANTTPGMAPMPATDRAATKDSGEPVAESVTPDKPDPTATAATPQQQNVQAVRRRASATQQSNPTIAGNRMPRHNINSVHVDPVTGQMFGNIKGHFVPLDKEGWDVIFKSVATGITAYAAQTRRMNAQTMRSASRAQDDLLAQLAGESNHNVMMSIVSQFPGIPDYVVDTLHRGATEFSDHRAYQRHAGNIASAYQAGDEAGLKSSIRAMEDDIYEMRRDELQRAMKDNRALIDDLTERLETELIKTPAHTQTQQQLILARMQQRYLHDAMLAERDPRSRVPTTENKQAVGRLTVGDLEAMYGQTRDELRDAFKTAIEQTNWDNLDPMIKAFRDRLDRNGYDVASVDDAELLTIIGNALGIKDEAGKPMDLQPRPAQSNPETSSPGGQTLDVDELRRSYERTLQPGQSPTADSWNDFLRKHGYATP